MPQSRSAMCEIQRIGSRSGMSSAMKRFTVPIQA